jgi:copper transport protein
VGLLVLASTGVSAHAFLLSTNPPGDSVLGAAPTQVALEFSEPVTPFGRGIDVYSPSGRQVARTARSSGRSLAAELDFQGSPEPGTYLGEWRVIAQDSHPSRGSFQFSFQRRSQVIVEPPAPTGSGGVSAAGVLLQALSRWLHFAGFAAVIGSLVFSVFILAAAPPPVLRRLAGVGILLLLTGALLSVVAQAASLGGLDPNSIAEVTASPFGRVAALQLGAALLVWAAMPVIFSSRRRALLAVAVLGASVAAVDGLAGHAASSMPFWTTWLLTSVHVAAMATWVGGVPAFLLIARQGEAAGIPIARRFAPIAAVSAGLAVASGSLLAIIHLRSPLDLRLAPYGPLLGLKIVLVGVLIGVAIQSRRRGRPGLTEAAAMAGVLVLASVLASLPPVR